MEREENLSSKLEQALKSNANLLLSANKNTDLKNTAFHDALCSFESAIQRLRSFFIQSECLHKKLNPSFYEQKEIEAMQEELERKDDLINEQVKKLCQYRAELEVIEKTQAQALTSR